MLTSLDDILRSTRRGLPDLQRRRPALERQVEGKVTRPSFSASLRGSSVAVIAEIKRRSPSAGVIREDLRPGEQAALFAGHGAAAVSVLTDGPHFGGSIRDLEEAAAQCALPLLRKDFILDEIQILEARAAGASAVLLIVRALEHPRLAALLAYASELGLDGLVEVHTALELATALDSGARVVGVNSRDLETFRVDTAAAWRLLREVPPHCVAVAESGILGRSDVVAAASAGADAVLVGTALSRSPAPEQLLRELAGVPRHER